MCFIGAPEQYLAAPIGMTPPQEGTYERVKTFTVDEPYMLNARAYAQIHEALLKLGYKNPDFLIRRISPERYQVIIADDISIWDTRRKTFID